MLCSTFRNLILLQKQINQRFSIACLEARSFSSKPLNQPLKPIDGTPPKKTKKPAIPKVTLISPDETVSIVTLEEAQKLSKRRDLKLVKIVDFDTKTERPVYKLMTGAQYFEEDIKLRQERKIAKENITIRGEKLLTVNTAINDHDLNIHLAKVSKWLTKKYEVRVCISGGTASQLENVYKKFESNFKDQARIVQMRLKGSDCKFQILPPKQENSSL